MDNRDNSKLENEELRVAHEVQIRHLFQNLKLMGIVLLLFGLILLVVLSFFNLSALVELTVLLFFGLIGGGYLFARGRSIMIAYQAIQNKEEKK